MAETQGRAFEHGRNCGLEMVSGSDEFQQQRAWICTVMTSYNYSRNSFQQRRVPVGKKL
ncbi:hypothetical protein SESBI_01857 [Sesbania bispinosa]|nr:hypothetical protein SESBI_01857 [Sesbania bispinosa]